MKRVKGNEADPLHSNSNVKCTGHIQVVMSIICELHEREVNTKNVT